MLHNLVFHHVDKSQNFQDFIERKFQKIQRKFKDLMNVKMNIEKVGQDFMFKMILERYGQPVVLHSVDHNPYKAASKVFSKASALRN
ncbi:HPF/RaiA family ribosome-associated protein [Bacteriovorax sp. Seq25_V]|uniref:HPF/RaiA family ribosome-associated protein n=1 Tax=Bacteriovorax sp. Seq25_V TaxID=1201288 RepID=UPI00038A44F9|nr:HPF/RaiA family ribosome-associated protein [Bacteriovorax sp. Seq25_V]EQC45365.1 sigma 54 modulation protein/S30EA ribosomal protein [Bacteriovorax sp. Seq25_V]